jgi:hypothetical protein
LHEATIDPLEGAIDSPEATVDPLGVAIDSPEVPVDSPAATIDRREVPVDVRHASTAARREALGVMAPAEGPPCARGSTWSRSMLEPPVCKLLRFSRSLGGRVRYT